MLLARRFENDEEGLAEFLETRLLSYLVPQDVVRPPEGVPRVALDHFPTTFPKTPALAASRLYAEGKSQLSDVIGVPGVVGVGVRGYYPSLTRPDLGAKYQDGRRAAARVCGSVFSAWRKAFLADWGLRHLVMDVELGRDEEGDHDRLGNPYVDQASTTGNIVWVKGAVALFYL